MKDFAIYLDLDGVMADYDAGIRSMGYNIDPTVRNDLNRSGTDNPLKREMYEAIKGTDYYYKLPLMPGALEIYNLVADADPIILTAAPKFGAAPGAIHLNPFWQGCAYHKRRWVEEKLLPLAEGEGKVGVSSRDGKMVVRGYHARIPIADDRFICTTSQEKQDFMHRKHSTHQILVDDRIANCMAWAEAGGIAIFHGSDQEGNPPVLRTVTILKAIALQPGTFLNDGGLLLGVAREDHEKAAQIVALAA